MNVSRRGRGRSVAPSGPVRPSTPGRGASRRALFASLGLIGITGALALQACSAPPELRERKRSASGKIIRGTPSTAAEDEAVVLLNLPQGFCTATLIAPNLVVTARHCVATQGSGQDPCALGADHAATSFSVSLGRTPSSANVAARGTRLFVPERSTLCGSDIALVQLDRDVAGAPVRKVRLSPLAKGETVSAVGYGKNENEQLTGRNARGGLRVEAVGPAVETAVGPGGQPFPFDVPANDVATGEATCHGDSGGPLFDAEGRLVGVTSRGVLPTCIGGPAIFTGVAGHADLVRSAAITAGHPLDAADAGADGGPTGVDAGAPPTSDAGPSPTVDAGADETPTAPAPSGSTKPESSDEGDEDDEDDDDADSDGVEDAEDDGAGGKSSKSRSREEADDDREPWADADAKLRAQASCSAPSARVAGDGAFTLLVALAALVARARRRA